MKSAEKLGTLKDCLSPRFFLLLLFICFSCSISSAKDFQTNGFTFDIPPTWVLNEKIPGEVNVQFDIKTTNGVVPVRFKGFAAGATNATAPELIKGWGKFLENPDKVEWQQHTHTINGREITYVEAWGALKYYSKSVKHEIYVPNFSFFGAVVAHPKGNVSIYMLGRTTVTDQLKPQFKSVIEEAVTNRKD